MFSYYTEWTPKYSDKIKPLVSAKQFPLVEDAVKAFEDLRKSLKEITLGIIDESKPFIIKADASETALSASLTKRKNQ